MNKQNNGIGKRGVEWVGSLSLISPDWTEEVHNQCRVSYCAIQGGAVMTDNVKDLIERLLDPKVIFDDTSTQTRLMMTCRYCGKRWAVTKLADQKHKKDCPVRLAQEFLR